MMDSSSRNDRSHRALQACSRCKRAKRRCDKALPACTLCSRLRKTCDYSESSAIPNANEFALLKSKVEQLEARLERSASSNTNNGLYTPNSASPEAASHLQLSGGSKESTFPAGFFLDLEVHGSNPIPKPIITVTNEIWTLLGLNDEIQMYNDTYFKTIHAWLPIVSKKRLSMSLSNPSLELTADLVLLLLSMRLIATTTVSNSNSVRTDLYWRVKSLAGSLENRGLLSMALLQSLVLVSAYEIGHSIFPSAYLTTGHTARLGHALGIHDRREAPQMLRRPGAWAEVEEMSRTFWAVRLLDRYVVLGSPGHPLATEDPSRTAVLPADDNNWDIGEMASAEPLYLSSKTSLPASWFQRTCQATHILGRYIRHRDDRLLEPKDRFTEAGQLLRTMHALTALLPAEAEKRPEQYGTPLALCYSSLIHLCDPYACTSTNHGERTGEEVDLQTAAIAGMKQAAADMCELSRHIHNAMFLNIDATSPLTADALYMAASTYAWLVHETGDIINIRAYSQLTDVLKAMEARWACSTEYLSLLEKTTKELYDDNPNLKIQLAR